MGKFLSSIGNAFWSYETQPHILVRSTTVVVVYRVVQLIIFLYVCGFVLIYSKGYQATSYADSSVITKVKGVLATNFSDEDFQISKNRHLYNRVWDGPECDIRSSESNGFFVLTNLIITPNQTLGRCPEDPTVEASSCTSDENCVKGYINNLGNGRYSGNCVPSSLGGGHKTCEIEAWCPVETDILPLKNSRALLEDAENFTVMIKNSIYFYSLGPKFKRNNMPADEEQEKKECLYNKITSPLCPVFRIKDLVEMAGENFSKLAYLGASMQMLIDWDCDLDWDFMQYCIPSYHVRRLDTYKSHFSKGWNFRESFHHEFEKRTLLKLYGLKFSIDVQAAGKKFSIVPTILNLASGLALMSLASFAGECVKTILERKEKLNENVDKNIREDFINGNKSDQPNEEVLIPLQDSNKLL